MYTILLVLALPIDLPMHAPLTLVERSKFTVALLCRASLTGSLCLSTRLLDCGCATTEFLKFESHVFHYLLERQPS
jgi:hypothetical protein